MSLTTDALARLYQQAKADNERPWKPGQQLTDAQLIAQYIGSLKTDLDLSRDEQYIRNEWWTNGQPFYSEEERKRGEQGIFG